MPEVNLIQIVSGCVGTLFLVTLLLLQVDAIVRRILPPDRLRTKRRREQRYHLEEEIATSIVLIRRQVNQGEDFDAEAERSITEIVRSDENVKNLVQFVLATTSAASIDDEEQEEERNQEVEAVQQKYKFGTPDIVAISLDISSKTGGNAGEFYIYLAFPQIDLRRTRPTSNQNNDRSKVMYGRRVQTPLEKFGVELSEAIHKQQKSLKVQSKKISPQFCFVLDASSGYGTNLLTESFEKSKAGFVVVKEPAWIVTIAYLIQVKTFSSHENIEKFLFSLFHLQAAATIGENEDCEQLIFVLPGQSCTAALLPYLYRAFKEGKFIFSIDNCENSVTRAIQQAKVSCVDDKKSAMSMPQNITSTIPISPPRTPDLGQRLAMLPSQQAGIVEAWMSSVIAMVESSDACQNLVVELNNEVSSEHKSNEEQLKAILTSAFKFVKGDISEQAIDAGLSGAMVTFNKSIIRESIFDKDESTRIANCVSLLHGITNLPKWANMF